MNKELTWAEHIHRCLELGVSKKAYCEEHNLSYQLFFHNQRKLTESKSSVGFKEILLRNEHMQNRESDDASESVLQVQFANWCTLFFRIIFWRAFSNFANRNDRTLDAPTLFFVQRLHRYAKELRRTVWTGAQRTR
ncbi:MAG: IS66 family insertion sequence element accessory protein TnpA [Flavobacteriales bacterium]